MKDHKWRIEVTEHQLRLMAQCVEDCHRFIGGQMELSNLCTLETPWQSYEYFHEFMDGMYDRFPELLNLEWKGV